MAQSGTLIVRAFVSRAQLPVPGATVIVSVPDGSNRQKLLSITQTNESGIAGPISLSAPEIGDSLTPNNNSPAFSNYTLIVEHPDYQLALFQNLQVFPGVETIQDVPLIPLSLNGKNENDITTVTPQPLQGG